MATDMREITIAMGLSSCAMDPVASHQLNSIWRTRISSTFSAVDAILMFASAALRSYPDNEIATSRLKTQKRYCQHGSNRKQNTVPTSSIILVK